MQDSQMERHGWVWIFTIIIAFGLLPQQGNAANSKVTMGEDGTIRIPAGSTDGVIQVLIKAENLTAAVATGNPELKDLGGAGTSPATTVEFKNAEVVDAGISSRAWLWTVRIKDLPANSSQKRSARFSFGNVEQYFEYIVTNMSPAAFTWSVAAPGVPWLVWFGYPGTQRATAVVVTTGDYPASNFRLAQSTLRDGLGTSQIAIEDIELCDRVSGPCGHLNINARTNRTFYVLLMQKADQGFWQSGKYTGALSFAVNERPELQTVNVTLQISSFRAKLAGAVLVGIGIIVAWLTSVWARARMFRLEALRPVAVLKESVTMLIDEINSAKKIQDVDLKCTRKSLGSISVSLETRKLDNIGLLPPKVPGARSTGVDTSAKLKEYLDSKCQQVDCLSVVICDGMRNLWNAWKEGLDPKVQSAIKMALNALDHVGDKVGTEITTRADAKQSVNTVLQAYQTATTPAGVESDQSFNKAAEPTVLQVSWQIERLSGLLWLVWGILTFIVGVAVLIVTNPGFGTSLDLVFCLLWGFGLPVGIDKLQQLGPGGIATTIGIPSLPKSNP